MPGVASTIHRLEAAAQARLDGGTFDYFAGGSGSELTLDEATAAWARYRFAPHVLRAVEHVDPSVELFDTRLPGPVGIAPVAFQGLLDDDGEVAMARGAGGHLMVVSTRANRPIEEVAAQFEGPWWFQVYVTADRTLSSALARRAAEAGASALVLTGDTPYVGRKARAGRAIALGTDETMRNFLPHLRPDSDPVVDTEQNPGVTEQDIARLADDSGLPVLVKGVLRADDTVRCLEAGAAGVIVSNHGGRQLDRALPAALALPEVVAAAGDAPVLVDGGIRSGHDVLVALALGARAALIGRPAAYALCCEGADGVRALLDAFTDEFAHVMALAGCRGAAELTPDLVREL